MNIPCKNPTYKLEDRVKLDRIAVSGLEHVSMCYYQISWYTSATHGPEFVPPYFYGGQKEKNHPMKLYRRAIAVIGMPK